MKVGLNSGVDLQTGEVVDVKEQKFIREYFRTVELIRQTKEALKEHKRMLDEIYHAYRKYIADRHQGKLFRKYIADRHQGKLFQ